MFYRMLKFNIKRRAQRIIRARTRKHTHTYIYQNCLKNIFKTVFTLSFQMTAWTIDSSLLDFRRSPRIIFRLYAESCRQGFPKSRVSKIITVTVDSHS